VSDAELTAHTLPGLGDHAAVVGVVIFGSLARNELTEASDVDVLIVHKADASVPELRSAIKREIAGKVGSRAGERFRPFFYSPNTLLQEMDKHPSFAAHLSDEGVVVYATADFDTINQAIRKPSITRQGLRDELATRLGQLKLFADLSRFNGQFVPCLAQLYAIGKAVVIVKLLQNGIREYRWRKVFDTYSEVRPGLDADLSRVAMLRAYYDYVRDRSELPISCRDVDERYVDDVMGSITAVAAS
jgi:Nucleotidyltransferase domain